MVHYKLTYFNFRARAECARLIFHAAGVQFEDVRVETGQWPELKKDAPFGQLPVLEIDGVKLCQSYTIARFLANRFGLAGKTDMEKAQADMIVDCIVDMIKLIVDYLHENEETKKTELKKKLEEEHLPTFLANLEKFLITNKGGDGYFVGDSMTWADIAFTDGCAWVSSIGLKFSEEKTPKLKALTERVESHPKIAEWIKNRPETPM